MLGWLKNIVARWRGGRTAEIATMEAAAIVPAPPRKIERIILSDGVARTLVEDYAEHRRTPRGNEEIGWILLGLRKDGEAIALAALPAGAERDAGSAHIQFNSDAQELASRIVRQKDRRLQIIGVVHTHPGSLRSPSDGDFHGDSAWVGQLRGGEGVFGIGTADVRPNESVGLHMQISGDLCFNWYILGAGERRYRTLPVQVTIGPDLALPLRPVWNAIESFATPVNKLCRQFAKVQLDVIDEASAKMLCVKIALAPPNQQIRLLLSESDARYYWDREGELIAIDPHEQNVDRAVYLILAELAKEPADRASETPALVES